MFINNVVSCCFASPGSKHPVAKLNWRYEETSLNATELILCFVFLSRFSLIADFLIGLQVQPVQIPNGMSEWEKLLIC